MPRQFFQVFFYDELGHCLARCPKVWGLNLDHAIRRIRDKRPELEETYVYGQSLSRKPVRTQMGAREFH